MSITENLIKINNDIPEGVKLVAVSKTKPIEDILAAYNAGHRLFGENKAQELSSKHPQLPDDIQWHFIGHLQTNKVKYIIPFVSLIHSIDRIKLLREVNKQAAKVNRVVDCLLQFHIATEETKFGLNMEEAVELLSSEEYIKMENVRICGIMGMATNTKDVSVVRKEFRYLREIKKDLKENYFQGSKHFTEISMGMSGDYKIAIEEGSTIVRIGSAIFGVR
jgi:pyridoxal phosphate enzyme (YggS family)